MSRSFTSCKLWRWHLIDAGILRLSKTSSRLLACASGRFLARAMTTWGRFRKTGISERGRLRIPMPEHSRSEAQPTSIRAERLAPVPHLRPPGALLLQGLEPENSAVPREIGLQSGALTSHVLGVVVGLAALFTTIGVEAQPFPNRPLRIIVGFAA